MTYVRADINGRSSLATLVPPQLHDTEDRTVPVFGVAIHCTGSGAVEAALNKGQDPLKYIVAYYLRPDSFFGHYVIGFDGTIAQVADEHEKAPHVGYPAEEHQAFLSGAWEQKLPASYVSAWKQRWPGVKSPAHLFPGPSPNNAYVGIELLVWQEGCAGRPTGMGKYTTEQYASLVNLCLDVSTRWSFPSGWEHTGRLACHEDLNPLTRTAKGQGWDPGVLRQQPHFDWGYFTRQLSLALTRNS